MSTTTLPLAALVLSVAQVQGDGVSINISPEVDRQMGSDVSARLEAEKHQPGSIFNSFVWGGRVEKQSE